jgi:SAM-dependent methyltransferase
MTRDDAPRDHWFEDLADHLGPAYLRYSFTMGTAQEVEFLTEVLGLEPGMTVLDVGCGPGRHAVALARAGISVIAVDISEQPDGAGSAGEGGEALFDQREAIDGAETGVRRRHGLTSDAAERSAPRATLA